MRPITPTALAGLCLAALAVPAASAATAAVSELTLEQRAACHRAVEQVYWQERLWPAANGGSRPPLDARVPTESWRAAAEETLRLTRLLEERWGVEITAARLQAEVDRMAVATRRPELLRELFAALGGDAYRVAECLARPRLVQRLARERFGAEGELRARDAGQDDGLDERSFERWWAEERRRIDVPRAAGTAEWRFRLPAVPAAAGAGTGGDGSWESTAAIPLDVEGKAVWTGSEMLIWGRHSTQGYRYDPATDTWSLMTTVDAPQNRREYTAVWTGSEMVVWGGCSANNHRCTLATGGAYDPVADRWRAIATAPISRTRQAAVWTGSEMLIWGGCTYFNDNCSVFPRLGAAYDPAADSWRMTSEAGVPSGHNEPAMVWTGSELIVFSGGTLGGRYDPAADAWSPMSFAGAPAGRLGSLVWTGSEAIAWGGCTGSPVCETPTATGGRYHPATDSWAPVAAAGAPSARWWQAAVWSGSEMVVWGGYGGSDVDYLADGGRYDPATDSWWPVAAAGAPTARARPAALWTGDELLIWGGVSLGSWGVDADTRSGARYDPEADAWTPVRQEDPFSLRARHTTVWTGAEMIVFGGDEGGIPTGTGRVYEPATDSWRVLSEVGSPSSRRGHSAVWTGSEMIVWGGPIFGTGQPGDGYCYDPVTDAWTPVSTAGAPEQRAGHSAVWTGSEMIVWGGSTWTELAATGGGRYDPAADVWSPLATAAQPAGRSRHQAFWTGEEMIVWGGRDSAGPLADGGRYSPAADAWSPMSSTGAPAVWNPAAVWTGSEMIVWGGGPDLSSVTDQGARYRPATDGWTPTPATGAPSARRNHTAVWSGDEMLVWGGCAGSQCFFGDPAGGAFDPAAGAWRSLPAAGAPESRSWHGAVWAGDQMIVWGGITDRNGFSATGARYLPPGVAPIQLFADSFESGTMGAWSSSSGAP